MNFYNSNSNKQFSHFLQSILLILSFISTSSFAMGCQSCKKHHTEPRTYWFDSGYKTENEMKVEYLLGGNVRYDRNQKRKRHIATTYVKEIIGEKTEYREEGYVPFNYDGPTRYNRTIKPVTSAVYSHRKEEIFEWEYPVSVKITCPKCSCIPCQTEPHKKRAQLRALQVCKQQKEEQKHLLEKEKKSKLKSFALACFPCFFQVNQEF